MEIHYFNRKWSQGPICTVLMDADAGLRMIVHVDMAEMNINDSIFFLQTLSIASDDMRGIAMCGGNMTLARKRFFPFPNSGTNTAVEREFVEVAVAA